MGERSRTTKRAASGGQLDGARHVIRFTGEDVATQRAPFLRDLLDILVDGAQQATRLQIDGRSTAPGTPPAWLEDAAAFEVEQIQEREIILRAPSLTDALSHRSRQLDLFAAAEPSRSCLDYLEDSLDDALAGREDSDRCDRPLMATLEGLGRLFRHGVDSIELINGRTLRIDPGGVEAIRALRQRTPEDRRVAVGGKLDAIRHSGRSFTLVLTSGETLRGIAAEAVDPSDLARLFGQPAIVSGMAKFRPSGKVLRVEAERIDPATGDLAVWSTMPRPLDVPTDPYRFRVPQGPNSGIAALLGSIPMDDTEEEFLAAIEALS
ncbi:uncharacterized protein SOCE26_100710 [Sorangium cellulosum]|uniref:Uncharacterized protein n=1 Tax=Sorangium cellulosum TaxID=56 RepID=A0A2L0FAF8_SORCE|nr:hypothetical protein [Sorangium cellulosum]AUX48533.1 uncharacterized protein SOCE26_100710 [Sorangium cellulosum]